MECLEIVCEEKNQPTGEILPRHQVISEGLWCRSTNIFVINSAGEILCHRRSMEKERMPGAWSTHLGGHVSHGETYEINAQKELEEEIGVSVSADQLVAWRTTKIGPAKLWVREYVTLLDVDLADLTPQEGEIDQLAWLSPMQIMEESSANREKWCAGTYNFLIEYHCLKAALTVAASMEVWHPIAHNSAPRS